MVCTKHMYIPYKSSSIQKKKPFSFIKLAWLQSFC